MSSDDLFRDPDSAKNKVFAAVIIVATTLVVLLVGTFYFKVMHEAVELDEKNCPVDASLIPAYTAILLDATEPFSPIQQEAIKKYYRETLETIPERAQVTVYVVDDNLSTRLRPRLAICHPGSAEGRSWIYENPRRIDQKLKHTFEKPLDEALDQVLPHADARSSPIMEALQVVGVREFPTDSNADKRIIIFSDMLQHTGDFSMYREWPTPFSSFRSSAAYQQVFANLPEVSVRVFYIRRPGLGGEIQGRRHVEFWDEFFQAAGASIEEVSWVEG